MTFYRRYARKRRRRFKRGRGGKKKFVRSKKYLSRLRDKKINARVASCTLVEHRIKDIAKKEALKLNKPNYIVTRGVWLDPQAQPWLPLTDQWPPLASFFDINETQFHSFEVAKCGGYLETDVSAAVETGLAIDARNMFVRIKQIALQFHFVNVGTRNAVVDLQLTRFPYSKMALYLDVNAAMPAENPQPVYQDHKPFCTINTLTRELYKFYKQSDVTQGNQKRIFTVLARKRIVVRPGRMIDDPTGGGAAATNMTNYKGLRIKKTFKGLGKKEKYQIIQGNPGPNAGPIRGSLSDHRYFWSMRCTAPVKYLGVTAVKFCGSSMLDRQVVFDVGAPLAQ